MRLRWFLLVSLLSLPALVACSGNQNTHTHEHCHDNDCHDHGHDPAHHPAASGSAGAPMAPSSSAPVMTK